MYRAAWLTCALVALAHARIYDRCELVRELKSLGVRSEHIATWVCIMFHESRFDTAANNPYSGDHGIFQISELYWCGPGKACHLPCSALRDDDITDDLLCALQIYEEHTRLQGNGFLAWVVYPQHCKHSTKKYLVHCDTFSTDTPFGNGLAFTHEESYTQNNMENFLPAYLAISNIIRSSYDKVSNEERVDWFDQKVDNVDNLRLPNSLYEPSPQTQPTTSSMKPSTTSRIPIADKYITPMKPWRGIKTNQFRQKQLFHDKSSNEEVTLKEYSFTSGLQPIKDRISHQNSSTETSTQSTLTTTTVTQAPETNLQRNIQVIRRTSTPVTTTSASETTLSSTQKTTKARPRTLSQSLEKFEMIPFRPEPTTLNPFTLTTTQKPLTSSTATESWSPVYEGWPLITRTSTSVTSILRRLATPRPFLYVTSTMMSNVENVTTTIKPKFEFPLYKFTSQTESTPATTKVQSYSITRTPRPNYATITTRQQTTTSKPKTTQSIFDLYLNPTKPPKLQPFFDDSFPDSRFKIKIFASGTTLAPLKVATNLCCTNKVKNLIKRHNSRNPPSD